ncbi:DUF1330 domain-containing protein [Gammaproteobacteria bacterium]|jgi:uncharacterized protein (DUF1330 family)|nr:DUF1330 domain-containing protein [Gammaproteobacteria bacterium]
MSAYVVVHLTILDGEKIAAYSAVAGPSVTNHGGEFVCKGPAEMLHGDAIGKNIVIVKFDSKAAAKAWYNSDEYQAIIPIRNEGAESCFILGGE